jgi:tetratricopeptide (TPR) repeat protein
MNICNGTPAELCALSYVEGTLPEHQVELFEAHYFECPVCFEYLNGLQAMRAALARFPAGEFKKPTRKRVLTLPVKAWALGTAAAIVLLAAIFSFRGVYTGPKQSPIARSAPAVPVPANPAGSPRASSPARIKPSQLADLALPPFVGPNLRGAEEDAQFESGMKDYERGDCRDAVAALAKVPEQSEDLRQARFYCAACEMRLGNLPKAAAEMSKVAAAGDSPQQESALYYEAQIALAIDNPAAAHRYLVQAIALQGDLEKRARDEDRKVQEFFNEQPAEGAEKPESVGR